MTRRISTGSGLQGKRHRKAPTGPALTNAAVKRLARRAGVRRINAGVYEEARPALRQWLGRVIQAATVFTEHARRMTVTLNDVLLALKRQGITLYGITEKTHRRKLTRRLAKEEIDTAHRQAVRRQQRAKAAAASREEEQQQQQQQQAEPAAQLAAEEAVEQEQQVGGMEADERAAAAAEVGLAEGGKPSVEEQGEGDSSPAPLTPDRALEIQACLSDYRDSLPPSADPEVPVEQARRWVCTHLSSHQKAPCSQLEFDTVLAALERQEAIMLIEDDCSKPRCLVFTT